MVWWLWLRGVVGAGVAGFPLSEVWLAGLGGGAGWGGFLWTTGLILILTQFIAPRTATTHYTMLLLPLFCWFAHLGERLGQRAGLVVVGIEAALLVGQWAIFLATLRGNYETALVYLPFPLLMLVVQMLTRKSSLEGEP